MLDLPEGVFERLSFVVLFSVCICEFVVVIVTVDVDDVVMVVETLLSTFTVCPETVFLFIAGLLFRNNTLSRLDSQKTLKDFKTLKSQKPFLTL